MFNLIELNLIVVRKSSQSILQIILVLRFPSLSVLRPGIRESQTDVRHDAHEGIGNKHSSKEPIS